MTMTWILVSCSRHNKRKNRQAIYFHFSPQSFNSVVGKGPCSLLPSMVYCLSTYVLPLSFATLHNIYSTILHNIYSSMLFTSFPYIHSSEQPLLTGEKHQKRWTEVQLLHTMALPTSHHTIHMCSLSTKWIMMSGQNFPHVHKQTLA